MSVCGVCMKVSCGDSYLNHLIHFRYGRPGNGASNVSTSTRRSINALSPEAFEGPKLPVRAKEQDHRWSAEELVPTWYMDLDINFADEYSLMGNCIKVCSSTSLVCHSIYY